MPIDPSLNSVDKVPIDKVTEMDLAKTLMDKATADFIGLYFDNFFEEMAEHTKMLNELTKRNQEALKDLGVPGMISFDARLYQIIVAPGAAPETVHYFTNQWPALSLNAEALSDTWVAYDETPTQENHDALVVATNNFNEVFSTFQTRIEELLEKPPNEAIPKSPPNTV